MEAGFETARKIEEHSIVLLKNEKNVLPLDRAKVKSIAVIGSNARHGHDLWRRLGAGRSTGPQRSAVAGARVVPDIAAESDQGEGAVGAT